MSKVICYTVLVVFMIALINIDLIMAVVCSPDGIGSCGGGCTALGCSTFHCCRETTLSADFNCTCTNCPE